MGLFSRKKRKEEPVVVEKAPVIEQGIPAEVVAVIAAAVACVIGAGAKVVGIRRSTRAGAGKAAWRNAGVAENTRAF